MKRFLLFGPDSHCPGTCFDDFVKDFNTLEDLKCFVIEKGFLEKYCNTINIIDLKKKSQIWFSKQEELIEICKILENSDGWEKIEYQHY